VRLRSSNGGAVDSRHARRARSSWRPALDIARELAATVRSRSAIKARDVKHIERTAVATLPF